MKRLHTIIVFLILLPLGSAARKPCIDASVELYSSYIWRGNKVCGTQISPSATLHLGKWSLQGFGFLAIDNSYKEIDWDLYYTHGDVSLHFADYFCHGTDFAQKEDYFNWKKGETTHVLEAIACYAPSNLPLAAKWFTFVYGSWLPKADGSAGRSSFSSYLELEAFHCFESGGRLSLFGGASVLKGDYTDYTRDFAVIHLEMRYTREIDVTVARIPVTFSYVVNPFKHTAFLNAGVGIAF